MSKLSLCEIQQSQLDKTPIVDGQLVCCLDTGNTYRDTAGGRVRIGSDLERVSELPLAPLAGKIYYLPPGDLYIYNSGWVMLNTDTWRGIQNNLTSDSTTDSLSAAQGKALKGLIDGKAASGHTHNYAGSSSAGGAATSANKVNAALTINLNGTSQGAWDGSSAKSISITAASVGATSVTISRW